MTNNNKNEHPYALFIWRNRLPVLKKRRVDRKQYCFQNNHIPDFCVHYSLALFFHFFKTVLLLALYPPDKTLFTLALLGELYRNGIMLNILGDFFLSLSICFWDSFRSMCSDCSSRSCTAAKDHIVWTTAVYSSILHVYFFTGVWKAMCCAVLSRFSHVQLCATLSTVAHQGPLSMEILPARILEWVAVPSSRGSSPPRDRTWVSKLSCIYRQALFHWHHWGSPLESSMDPKFSKSASHWKLQRLTPF